MDNAYYLENLCPEQARRGNNFELFASEAGKVPCLDFQTLFWLYAAIVERAELSHPNKRVLSVTELSREFNLPVKDIRNALQYLVDNGYLETLRLYLKNNFDCRLKKSKVHSLTFEE